MRLSHRKNNDLRDVILKPHFNKYAEGSCLIQQGDTHVLCTASVEEKVPPHLRGRGRGWVTAEYGLLPRATHTRLEREAKKGPSGRTQEIQRLIGRSLRAVVDFSKMGERTILVDCDVIQADGGTRTASITGGFVALYLAFQKLQEKKLISEIPIIDFVAAVSCGICQDIELLDLDYDEDSKAQTDANFVITGKGSLVEVQGTAEEKPFSEEQFLGLIHLAKEGVGGLIKLQQKALLKL